MFVSPLIRSEAETDLLTLARNIVCMFVCVGFFSQDDDPRILALNFSSLRAEFPAPYESRHGKLPLSVFQISPTNVLRQPMRNHKWNEVLLKMIFEDLKDHRCRIS
jgi:hypothetical protein